MAVAKAGLEFEDCSPLTEIMADKQTGKLKESTSVRISSPLS